MLYDKNLVDITLRLNRLDPIFRTIQELPDIGRKRRTRNDIRLGMNLPINFMVVRQKPDQIFLFRILSTVLFTDHKPIIFLFTQKSNPNLTVYRFQIFLIKLPNLHIVWTAGKSLPLPSTLSRNTPPELLTRKATVEIPQKI